MVKDWGSGSGFAGLSGFRFRAFALRALEPTCGAENTAVETVQVLAADPKFRQTRTESQSF